MTFQPASGSVAARRARAEDIRLLRQLRRALRAEADAPRAAAMKAYMKSAMPYHGVNAPTVRTVCRRILLAADFSSAARWRRQVLHLWRHARFREERYGALHLAADRRARALHTPADLGMYREMIVSGAWWDYVDDMAGLVGILLQQWPSRIKPQLLAWSRGPDLWLRRVAIISQLRFKSRTDLKFLYACIEPSLQSREFFLRKAIGWALREYAWTDAQEVRRYVRAQPGLSGLSRREALKNIMRRRRRRLSS